MQHVIHFYLRVITVSEKYFRRFPNFERNCFLLHVLVAAKLLL